MNFNSIGSSSNFSTAGKSAADDFVRIHAANRRNAPDMGGIAMNAATRRSKEKIAATKAQTEVARVGITTKASVKSTEIKETATRARDHERRKAGALATAGKLFGSAGEYMGEKRIKREVGESDSYYDNQITKSRERAAKTKGILESFKTDTPSPSTSTPSPSGGKSGETNSAGNGAFTGTLQNLSDEDKKWIAYTVSSEAQLGTDDIYGVAGVVINRMKSDKYPTSAYNVGHQKGQFEGVEIGNSRHDQQLYDQLFSPEGIQKLDSTMTKLDGRDSFKGQALIHNRSSRGNKDGQLDPMFSDRGNYYHHSWQK